VVFAVAASVLIVASLATWALLRPHNGGQMAAVVDLRNRSIARGTEPPPSEPPLEIPRNTSHLDIYLPLGSTEGNYEVCISAPKGQLAFRTKGRATIREGAIILSVSLTPAPSQVGLYVLQIRKAESEWNSYAIRIR
jgi:hypothetical protein